MEHHKPHGLCRGYSLYIKFIIKRIIITLFILIFSFFLILIVIQLINLNFFSFKEIKKLNDKYKFLFNDNYKSNISLIYSYNSLIAGNAYFYKYNSFEICILELNQYNNINFDDIGIKNYILNGENTSFIKFRTTIIGNKNSNNIISLYPKFKKVKQIKLYVTSKINKTVKKDNKYFYLNFIGDSFAISSNDEYPELVFALLEKETSVNTLILKKQNKIFFIIEYKSNENSNNYDINLLDLIKVD